MNTLRYTLNWIASRFLRRLADAHRHFGNAYGNRQEYEAAMSNYGRAIRLDPDYIEAIFSRGVLHWREFGDYDLAIQDLTRVLDLAPSRAEARLNRGLAYRMRQDVDQAIADFECYLEAGTDDFWLGVARDQLAELRNATDSNRS